MNDRHAYLIIAHNQPELLRRLVELLDDERNDIYIHADRKMRDFDAEALRKVCTRSTLHILPQRISVHWGGYSIIRVEMELLKAATRQGRYAYYHLLSGVCLPIKSQDEIHRFFGTNGGREFVDLWPMKKTTYSRFHYYTVLPEGERNFLTRLLNNAVKGLLMLLGIKMNRDVDFRYGSQWFSITDGFARYITSQEEWVDRVFAHSSTCDEVFVPTLLYRSPYASNLSVQRDAEGRAVGNMRFIDWTRGTSIRHPYTFTIEDHALLMSVPHLFARKFSLETDRAIIDAICSSLGERREA